MNMRVYIIIICLSSFLLSCGSNPASEPVVATQEQVKGIPTDDTMIIPPGAFRTPSGYMYYIVTAGTDNKPDLHDAVKVRLRVRNLEGDVLQDEARTLSIAHSTPFFEEILPLMTFGSTFRIWGDQKIIWEIDMISIDESYRAPEDVGAPSGDAVQLEDYPDIYWKSIEVGSGEEPHLGEAWRVHIARWDQNGSILESSRAGRGMLLILEEKLKAADPAHYALITKMRAGSHIRVWFQKSRYHMGLDIVEDIWLAEHITQLDVPKDMAIGAADDRLQIMPGVFMKYISRAENPVLLEADQNIEVDMTCWNSSTGALVDATYIRDKHDVMQLTPKIGVWLDILKKAAPGDTIMAWINSDNLPESVSMNLVCRIQIFDIIRSELAE